MLALRLQRTGRKKLPQYRLIAQEHHIQPTSGKVAAHLGNYNPHTKEANFDTEKIEFYLSNGAQPSNSVAKLLQNQGIKLPDWVAITQKPDKKKQAPVAETKVEEPDTKAEEAEAATESAEELEEKPEAADEKAEEPATEESTEVK